MPLAVMFHSGTFDYVFLPRADAPTSGQTYQESLRESNTNRLTSEWAITQVFTTLGLYPNYNTNEVHAGSLPAALAEKGIAMLLPANCWGDNWHNRSSLAENNFAADFFFRNGRTAAEFAYLHATSSFPPGNPLELPIDVDLDRVYLVGLGEGSRAVSELLSLRENTGESSAPFSYDPAAVFMDSAIDDLRPYYDNNGPTNYPIIRSGLNRIFPGGQGTVMPGSLAWTPLNNIPDRIGFLYSANDSYIPEGANELALLRLEERAPSDGWVFESVEPARILSNADALLAKSIADFLVEGVGAVDPAYIDD
jgi:hypothetical protein